MIATDVVKTLFIDGSRCIGCRACEAACRECDSHKGESMISVDFFDRSWSTATQPTVCMHCEDPVAPCAQVCPAMAILITPDGVVQQAEASRCIGCLNCVYACPFGVPKFDTEARLMKKCNLCYDRTSQGNQPVRTRVAYVVPEDVQPIDVSGLLGAAMAQTPEEPWIL